MKNLLPILKFSKKYGIIFLKQRKEPIKMALNNIGEIVTPIVLEAGKIMLSAHADEAHDVSEKGSAANFVTVYDVKIQEFLLSEIKKVIPDAYFIAEEKENSADALNHEHCFIIDPIDGTANFVHDYHTSAISVGVYSYGKPLVGIIYNPYFDELFSAETGKGAFMNGKPIHVSERDLEHSLVNLGTSPYYKEELADKTFDIAKRFFLSCSDLRRGGSAAIDLSNLAMGRLDVFFECILSPWDIAAGAILIEEAGGVITDMNGDPIDFSKPSPVIASNKKVYKDVLKLIKNN